MRADNPGVRTLHRALGLLGSPEALAAALGVAPEQLQRWLHAGEAVPTKVYLAALDIVARGRAR